MANVQKIPRLLKKGQDDLDYHKLGKSILEGVWCRSRIESLGPCSEAFAERLNGNAGVCEDGGQVGGELLGSEDPMGDAILLIAN